MSWTATVRRGADDAVLKVARGSQALAIETLDRVVGVRAGKATTPLQLVTRLQFALAYAWSYDPAKLVDERYELAQSLWSLHREFAQRLFDVTDPAKATSEIDRETATASIVPFPIGRARSSR